MHTHVFYNMCYVPHIFSSARESRYLVHGELSQSRQSLNSTKTGQGFHNLERHALDMPQAQRKVRVQVPSSTPPVELYP